MSKEFLKILATLVFSEKWVIVVQLLEHYRGTLSKELLTCPDNKVMECRGKLQLIDELLSMRDVVQTKLTDIKTDRLNA
jgi:hypothetical protein|tara:strand:- start:700 stop:936 length:237 start_codon:yes stop_codon:yes gene_type:complete